LSSLTPDTLGWGRPDPDGSNDRKLEPPSRMTLAKELKIPIVKSLGVVLTAASLVFLFLLFLCCCVVVEPSGSFVVLRRITCSASVGRELVTDVELQGAREFVVRPGNCRGPDGRHDARSWHLMRMD
jgi:hypothetical protein